MSCGRKSAARRCYDEAFPCGSVDFFFLTASAASVFGVAGSGLLRGGQRLSGRAGPGRTPAGLSHASASTGRPGEVSDSPPTHRSSPRSLRRLGSRELTPPMRHSHAWEHVHRHDIAQAVVVPVSSASGQDTVRDRHPNGRRPREQRRPGRRCPPTTSADQLIAQDPGHPRPGAAHRGIRTGHRPAVHRTRPQFDDGTVDPPRDRKLGRARVSATMLWNHPTVESLAAYLTAKLAPCRRTGGRRHDRVGRTHGRRARLIVRPRRIGIPQERRAASDDGRIRPDRPA